MKINGGLSSVKTEKLLLMSLKTFNKFEQFNGLCINVIQVNKNDLPQNGLKSSYQQHQPQPLIII